MTTYRYALTTEGNDKYADVEHAGRLKINNGENVEERIKAFIVSTQQIPEDTVELKKVDDLMESIITSKQTPNKR